MVDEHTKDLQIMNMRTSSPVKPCNLAERIVDGVALIILTGMVFAIWFMAGYLLANV